ncbi:MAG: HupE/UreJ family protein [Pseudomonadota bacterium]
MKQLASIFVFIIVSSSTWGHSINKSISMWEKNGAYIQATLIFTPKEAGAVVASGSISAMTLAFLQYSKEKVILQNNGKPCILSQTNPLPANGDFIRLEFLFHCKNIANPKDKPLTQGEKSSTDDSLSLTINLLMDSVPFHTHFVRWKTANTLQEFIFHASKRTHEISFSKQAPPPSYDYTLIGLKHIATGYDHIVFLTLLLLIAQGIKPTLLAITGFTLGHSFSLGLMSLGVLSVRGEAVESLIGLTIVIAAAEVCTKGKFLQITGWILAFLLASIGLVTISGAMKSVIPTLTYFGMAVFVFCYLHPAIAKRETSKHLLVMTLVFGFIHGFGFAGFLQEVGLPKESIVPALFFFNLGIEIGQILLASIIAGVLLLVSKTLFQANPGQVPQFLASVMAAAGSYWFFTRAF